LENGCTKLTDTCDNLLKNDQINENFGTHELVSKPSLSNVKVSNDILLNSVRSLNDEFWNDFRSYLTNEKHSPSSIRDKISYAKRFHQVLKIRDASLISSLSPDVKSHAMKSLASLSKYLGLYDEWLEIIRKYQLKWASGNKTINTFKTIFGSEGKDLKSMLKWISDVTMILPEEYKNILLFNTLTGLRPDEAQKSIWLIKTKDDDYIDKSKELLKHYRFPSIFLRKTKNAYVSVINDQILEMARNTPDKENYYNSLRKKISIKNGYAMNLYFCRKVFATYLRNKGVEAELIDWLQGRSRSVFVNFYYRPDIHEIITKKIRPILNELRNELVT
jgi:hypothetical protein